MDALRGCLDDTSFEPLSDVFQEQDARCNGETHHEQYEHSEKILQKECSNETVAQKSLSGVVLESCCVSTAPGAGRSVSASDPRSTSACQS